MRATATHACASSSSPPPPLPRTHALVCVDPADAGRARERGRLHSAHTRPGGQRRAPSARTHAHAHTHARTCLRTQVAFFAEDSLVSVVPNFSLPDSEASMLTCISVRERARALACAALRRRRGPAGRRPCLCLNTSTHAHRRRTHTQTHGRPHSSTRAHVRQCARAPRTPRARTPSHAAHPQYTHTRTHAHTHAHRARLGRSGRRFPLTSPSGSRSRCTRCGAAASCRQSG